MTTIPEHIQALIKKHHSDFRLALLGANWCFSCKKAPLEPGYAVCTKCRTQQKEVKQRQRDKKKQEALTND